MAESAIEYMRFDGFDEHSPTLERSPAVGKCMRSWWDTRRYPTVIKDPAVPCRSGDLVALLERGRDGQYRTMIKELRCTRDGKWWLCCDDAIVQLGVLYRPSSMTKIVALSSRDWGMNHDAPVTGATPAELEMLNSIPATQRAVAEWKEHGFERGVQFPGLHAVNIPDPERTDLPTTRDDPRNGLGRIAPAQLTVSTPSYDQPIAPTNLTATGIVKGVTLKWDAPSPRNSRQVYHVYQHTANTPFSSATRVMTVPGLEAIITLAAGVTRFFWVTGELNGIETSSVPSGNGVSGTPETADSADITPNAATDPVVNSVGASVIGGPAGSYDANIATASYTNTTGAALVVQAEASAQNVIVTWDTSPPATRRVYYSYSSASSGSGSFDMVNPAPESLGDIPQSPTAVTQIVLAAGDTLTFNLRGNVAHTDDAFLGWTSAAVRLTGLIR